MGSVPPLCGHFFWVVVLRVRFLFGPCFCGVVQFFENGRDNEYSVCGALLLNRSGLVSSFLGGVGLGIVTVPRQL